MKMLKKAIISLMFIIIGMLSIGFLLVNIVAVSDNRLPVAGNEVNLENLVIGDTYGIYREHYGSFGTRELDNLFCVQANHDTLQRGQDYELIAHIKITNGEAARIKNDGEIKEENGEKMITTNDSNKRLAIAIATYNKTTYLRSWLWGHFKDWISNSGKNLGISADFATKEYPTGTTRFEEEAQTANDKVNEKLEELNNAEAGEITNETNMDSISFESITYSGVDYIKVGPFKWNNVPSVGFKTFRVHNQNGYTISGVKLYRKTSEEEIWVNASSIGSGDDRIIKSEKNFYICIPKNNGVTDITQIYAKTKDLGIYDVSADVYFFKSASDDRQNLIAVDGSSKKGNKTITSNVNISIPGNLIITKKDSINQQPVGGARFVIYRDLGNNRRQYIYNNGTAIKYVETTFDAIKSNSAYQFTTDANGMISLQNLKTGNYWAQEVSAPSGYQAIQGVFLLGEVKTLETTNKLIGESPIVTNLELTKVNKDNHAIVLKNIKFNFKHEKYGWIINNGNGTISYSDTQPDWQFTTGEDGKISIPGVAIGNITYYEDESNLPYGYVLENNGIGSFTLVNTATNKVDVENERKYVRISGYVWEDLSWTEGKEDKANELYKDNENDQNDERLKGILVQLKDKDDNVVRETTTDESGSYLFEDIEIDQLPNYYIEFQYNGMSYQNVNGSAENYLIEENENNEKIARAEKQNTNRATEGSNRSDFNQGYETITYGKSNAYELTYETSQHKSELVYRKDKDESKYNYGYDKNQESRDPIGGVDEQYIIKANTKNTYDGYLDEIKTPEEIKAGDITEISDLNLGIKKRKKADLSLVKDLYSVKVTINEAEHIYKYADRFNPDLYAQYDDQGRSGYDMEPQVKFGQKYGNMSYTRALYPSDVHYTGENGLKVEATYKIGIKNNATDLKAVINELTDYYDTKYKIIEAGKEINNDGSIKSGTSLSITQESSPNAEYQKIKIERANLEVSENEGCIYVHLEVLSDKIVDILGNNDEIVKLDNIVEITSYSILDKEGNPYGGIDADSQPGNLVIEDTDTYEDDTDKAPGLKLVLQEERKVSGIVFEDSTDENLNSGETRQGDGTYDEGNEPGVKEVEVKLVNAKTGETAKVYNGTEWVDAITKTGDNGEYTIEGFIPEPDNYKIVYTWGDSTYKVQDYKSTIVNYSSYSIKGDEANLEWYKDLFKREYPNIEWNQEEDKEIRKSDATDNYATRQNIDAQTNMVTNSNKVVIENYSGEIKQKDGSMQTLITKMDSTTPTFRVNLEYDTTATNAREEYELDENGQIVMDGIYAVKKEGSKNHLKSIDFGIVERARQALSLSKQVKNVKLTLANVSVLLNIKIVKDETTGQMKLEDTVKHTVYIPDSQAANGQVKIELDNEIMQGATLEIEYGLQVSNISELDYLNSDYYLYGKGYGENDNQLVTLNASSVIDYLDNNIRMVIDENEVGEIIQENASKTDLINQGLLENTKEMKEWLGATSKIILTEKLSKELKPIGTPNADTKTEELALKVSKLLDTSSSGDETILENDAEIIKIEKTGGSSLITTPGNYVPGLSSSEYDGDRAESVLVVPPTGLGTNYIAYIILIISSLGILTAGIILIKKFVLR